MSAIKGTEVVNKAALIMLVALLALVLQAIS